MLACGECRFASISADNVGMCNHPKCLTEPIPNFWRGTPGDPQPIAVFHARTLGACGLEGKLFEQRYHSVPDARAKK